MKINKKTLILIAIVAIILLLIPYLAVTGAQIVENPIGAQNFGELVNILLEWVLMIGGPLAAGAIVYAGFLYVLSGGDKGKIETAKKTLTYAIVGLICLILAKSAGSIVASLFK